MGVVKDTSGEYAWDPGERYALVKASCHHHKHRKGFTACGGCYARAIHVLSELADSGVSGAQEFMTEAKAESEATK